MTMSTALPFAEKSFPQWCGGRKVSLISACMLVGIKKRVLPGLQSNKEEKKKRMIPLLVYVCVSVVGWLPACVRESCVGVDGW